MLKKVTSLFFTFILLMSVVQLPISSHANNLDFTEDELRENDYILYFVNAGDATPETVENDDKMGLYASKTDQLYGIDENTGRSWGLLTETVAPSRNDESTKEGTLLYYNGPQIADKAIEYQFELPKGDYDLTFGFKNPWSGRSVNIILNDENVSDGDFYIGANNDLTEFVHRQFTVEDGILKVRIQGPNTENLNNHNDPLINYIIIRQNILIPITDLEAAIAHAEQEVRKSDYYTTQSLAKLQAMIDAAQAIVNQVNNEEVDVKEVQNEMFDAIQNISIAKSELQVKEGIGIGATPFIISENDTEVNNVKLQWTEVTDTSNYVLLRAEKGNEYEEIYSGNATMVNDYGLDINQSYSYKVKAVEANGRYVESAIAEFEPFRMPENAGYFHNNEEGGFQGDQPPGGIKVGDTYYSYRQENDENGFKQINLYTSKDGYNWEFDKVVLDRDSHPDLKESKLESGKVFLNPNTGEIVGWYHYENNQDYSLARAGVASGKPGEKWTWHESLRPFDNESRDITYFIDDDGSGYIMSASNMNADFTLYELDETHTKVLREIDTIFEGLHREGPGFHKKGEYYYIFTSEAAGWYPTKGGYASAKSMEGPWTELRLTGNLSTFSSQSGYTFDVQGSETTSYFMNAYRWQHGWDLKPGGATDRWFLVTMNEGYAFYDYFEKIFIDYDTGYAIPLEDGMLVSQEKPAFAEKELEGQEASKANDGNYYSSWVSTDASWPTWWLVDLEEEYDITNIQISWYLHKGSEGAHRYTIETSVDGENFELAFDGTENKNYGFTSDYLNTKARYVRVNALDAKLHNNPNNWYTPQLSEVKVFGNEIEK